ncbi:MAG: peptidoglycan binding domain-containing protein, partial [Chloroflexia bacterium]
RAEQTAKQIGSAPLRLESEGRAWEITTQQLREWVRSTPGEGALQVGLDEVQLNSYLEGVAREASAPAQGVRLQWLDGRLEVTRPSQNGRRLTWLRRFAPSSGPPRRTAVPCSVPCVSSRRP